MRRIEEKREERIKRRDPVSTRIKEIGGGGDGGAYGAMVAGGNLKVVVGSSHLTCEMIAIPARRDGREKRDRVHS